MGGLCFNNMVHSTFTLNHKNSPIFEWQHMIYSWCSGNICWVCNLSCIRCFAYSIILILILQGGIYSPHFIRDKTGWERLSHLPKVTQVISMKTGTLRNWKSLPSRAHLGLTAPSQPPTHPPPPHLYQRIITVLLTQSQVAVGLNHAPLPSWVFFLWSNW